MSLLDNLKQRKNKLRPTSTIVKTPGGDILTESRTVSGNLITHKIGSGSGFIVDLKPDLQVAAVLQGLFMGSQDVTQDLNLLRTNKITDILSIGIKVDKLEGFCYHYFNALDLPEFNLLEVFDACFELIDRIINSGGSVYVHCNAGVSRSASVVIAYLMKTENLSYNQAYQYLKTVRPSVNPNPGFRNQLKLYELSLKTIVN